VFLDEEKLE